MFFFALIQQRYLTIDALNIDIISVMSAMGFSKDVPKSMISCGILCIFYVQSHYNYVTENKKSKPLFLVYINK